MSANTATRGPARAKDFEKWRLRAQSVTNAQLLHIIGACKRAAKAIGTFDRERETFYIDQGLTFADELRNREGR